MGSLSWAQDSRYLKELGGSLRTQAVSDWSKENNGVILSSPLNKRYLGVALPQYGIVYDYDFNTVNKFTVTTGISFGKSDILKSIFPITDKDRFRDNNQELPFGLKIGMTRTEVEIKTGKLSTIPHSENPYVQQVYFSNLPGYRSLDLTLWFKNEELVYVLIQTDRATAGDYQRRIEDTEHPMKMSLKDAIAEKTRTNRKLPYNFFFNGIDFIINGKLVVETMDLNTEETQSLMRSEMGADSVIQLKNQGYRAVWCTTDILDKESFFDEFKLYMSIALDSGFRNNGYPGRLVADYQSTEVSTSEHYYYSHFDTDNFLSRNQKPLFHLYQVKKSNEVVLDIYESSDNRSRPSKPAYIGVCTPEDTDLTLSDDEYLSKHHIDLRAIQARFKKDKGNAILRILDKEWSYPDNASSVGLSTSNGYNENTTNSWLKTLEIAFDKEFSRRVFKGDLPFGLKRGMSIWKIKNVLPGSEYEKWHAKKAWFTTYQSIHVTEKLDFDITMSFRKGKLARLVIELDEEESNSREWQILKSKIFPELTQ